MTTIIKNVHVLLTEELSEKIDSIVAHLEKLAASHNPDSVVCEFEIARTRHHQKGNVSRAEIHFSYNGHHYHVSAVGESELAALNRAHDEIRLAIASSKDRQRSERRRVGARAKRSQ